MTEAADSYLQTLTDGLTNLASEYVTSGGLRVSVKTNMGPEIPVFSGDQSGGGIVSALGIKAGVIVRNNRGEVVTTYGDPPPTDPVKVALLVGVGMALAVVIIRGVLPRR